MAGLASFFISLLFFLALLPAKSFSELRQTYDETTGNALLVSSFTDFSYSEPDLDPQDKVQEAVFYKNPLSAEYILKTRYTRDTAFMSEGSWKGVIRIDGQEYTLALGNDTQSMEMREGDQVANCSLELLISDAIAKKIVTARSIEIICRTKIIPPQIWDVPKDIIQEWKEVINRGL